MPVIALFIIFILLLIIAVPVSIALGISSVLPSVLDPSFTVGAKYLIRAMFGGLDSFPLLAVPMFVLSGIIMAKGRIIIGEMKDDCTQKYQKMPARSFQEERKSGKEKGTLDISEKERSKDIY